MFPPLLVREVQMSDAAVQVRRVRNWRQRFDRHADMVWLRRTMILNEVWVEAGDPVDKKLCPPGRLATLWSNGRIALADPPE